MKRILITGATSMIGSALTQRLISDGNKVLAVVRKSCTKISKLPESTLIDIVYCDMEEYGKLDNRIDGKIDIAIVTAWNGTRGNARNDQALQADNFNYNVDLLHSVIKLGCTTFMTAGSQAEYGLWNKEDKLSENSVPNPNTEYGKSKLKFYEYALKYCAEHGCRLLEPRFFSIYGPEDFYGTLVMSTLKKLLADEPCDLTECIQLWDFLYIDDAVSALCMLIYKNDCFGVYNLGSGVSAQLKEFVEKMVSITQSSSKLNFGKIPYPESGIVNVNPDVHKLFKIGWKPEVSFEMGIKEIVNNMNSKIVTKNRGGVRHSVILVYPHINNSVYSARRYVA